MEAHEPPKQITEEESYIKLAYAIIGQAIQDSKINETYLTEKHKKYNNKSVKNFERIKKNYHKQIKEELSAKKDAENFLAGTRVKELLAFCCQGSSKDPDEILELLLEKAKFLNPVRND